MAHYAKLSEENVVLNVEVVADEDCMLNGVEDEETGRAFLESIHGWSLWKKCSYNTYGGVYYNQDKSVASNQEKSFRKNFPSVGYTYDSTKDAFIPPQSNNSWTLDESSCLWVDPNIPSPPALTDSLDLIHYNSSQSRWQALDDEDRINYWNGEAWVLDS